MEEEENYEVVKELIDLSEEVISCVVSDCFWGFKWWDFWIWCFWKFEGNWNGIWLYLND